MLVKCPASVKYVLIATCRLDEHLRVGHPGKRCSFCREWLVRQDNDWLGHCCHNGQYCCGLCGEKWRTKVEMLKHLDGHRVREATLPRTQFEDKEEYEEYKRQIAAEGLTDQAEEDEAAGDGSTMILNNDENSSSSLTEEGGAGGSSSP